MCSLGHGIDQGEEGLQDRRLGQRRGCDGERCRPARATTEEGQIQIARSEGGCGGILRERSEGLRGATTLIGEEIRFPSTSLQAATPSFDVAAGCDSFGVAPCHIAREGRGGRPRSRDVRAFLRRRCVSVSQARGGKGDQKKSHKKNVLLLFFLGVEGDYKLILDLHRSYIKVTVIILV